jgi:hypothetical protein
MTAPEALLYDIELSRKIQTFCAWCGPAFVVLLFGGWGLMGGFIPLIPPSYEGHQVAAVYSEHLNVHRLGTLLALIGIFLTIPFFLAISMQIRRTELRVPSLAILQFASGIIVTVVLIIPMLLFIGGLFRPERPVELTKLVNDVSYVMLILPWPPILGQLGALALAIFNDRSPQPVFPRWLGYFNVWVAATAAGEHDHLLHDRSLRMDGRDRILDTGGRLWRLVHRDDRLRAAGDPRRGGSR